MTVETSIKTVGIEVDAAAEDEKAEARSSPYSEEELEEALQFLRLNVRLPSLPSSFVHLRNHADRACWIVWYRVGHSRAID